MTKGYRGIVSLCLAIALVAALAAASGVFLRGSGATSSATSIRGEQFTYVTDGVYAFNPQRVVAEGVGWDWVTLLFAVPALLLSLPGIARGSLRARLLAMGILGYFFYQYLMYAVFWAFGPLLPVFIALYALSAFAIVRIVATIDIAGLPERIGERFPRKGMMIFSACVAILLTAMWAQRLALAYRGDLAGAGLLGMPTFTVQAMDLGMLVPLAIGAVVLLRRCDPWGYLLGVVFAVKGATMAGAICAMLVSAAFVEGSLEVAPFAVFGAFAVTSGVLAWRMLAKVAEDEEPAHAGAAALGV
jgi:hypothetical protein